MGAEVRWLFSLVFILSIKFLIATPPHRKFEYKYSFKPPYLAQKDGSVPFWTYGGNAIASSDSVRLAPSMKSQKGGMWTKSKTNFDWWEVDILFRITGRGRVGADGLAFWFTENQGSYDGQVFGSSDKWRGLGVFFDSFDNDNKHNNPYIMAVVNDGTREFDHQNDGSTQALNGCLRDFRNKPYPTRARIEYYMNTLTVLFHSGMTNNEQDFEICFRVENVHLPKYGYFGISAATGGLADDHDVMHFLTTSLWGQGWQAPSGTLPKVSPDEEQKLTQEYADYQKKLDQQREEYKKEHPGAVKDPESEFEDWFESDSQRELRQILGGQNKIYDEVRMLNTKLDEIVGKQETTLSIVSSIHKFGGGAAIQPGAGQQQPMFIDTIKRHEVDAILTNLNYLVQSTKDISSLVSEVNLRTESILQQSRGQAVAAGGPSYDSVANMNEVRESLRAIKRDVEAAATGTRHTSGGSVQCATSCVSPLILVLVAVVQLILMFFYMLYRDSKEQQFKKFY